MEKTIQICDYCGKEVKERDCIAFELNRYGAKMALEWKGYLIDNLFTAGRKVHFCNYVCLESYIRENGYTELTFNEPEKPKTEFKPANEIKEPAPEEAGEEPVCEDCGKKITKKQLKISTTFADKPLCESCLSAFQGGG